MKGFIRQMTNTSIEIQCPYCTHDNIFPRKALDEGKYRKYCQVCGNTFSFKVDLHENFRGDNVE